MRVSGHPVLCLIHLTYLSGVGFTFDDGGLRRYDRQGKASPTDLGCAALNKGLSRGCCSCWPVKSARS